MRRFNLKYNRTRQYNSKGEQINQTFNNTPLQPVYRTQNARFEAKNCCVNVSGTKVPADRCNCTIAGCAGCPRCVFRVNISDQDVDRYPIVGSYVYVYTGKEIIGQVVEVEADAATGGLTMYYIKIVFDYESCKLPQPIMQIVVATPTGDLCLWPDGEKPTDASGGEFDPLVREQLPSSKGGRVGAPHRNPIAGARVARDCCSGAGCVQSFTLTDKRIDSIAPGTILPAGSRVLTGLAFGVAFDFIGHLAVPYDINENSVVVRLLDCNKPLSLLMQVSAIVGSSGSSTTVTGFIGTTSVVNPSKTPTNIVYADNYARSCAVPSHWSNPVCYDKRIRSGMQPKQKFCTKLPPSLFPVDNLIPGTISKPRKLFMCPGDYGYGKPYNYSYAQYLHNGSCKSFRRSQEKFLPIEGQPDSACPTACKGAPHPNKKCCLKSQYRKSGCDGCCPCDQPPCIPGKNAITVYKPNNKKFSKQGAVSAGSRLERLKLDTVRAANSKCPKGQRCIEIDGQRYGKGKYLAGRPAFMGQIYNARHPETTCMRTYRQQPFGIPQLTNKQRATRSRRVAGWKPTTKGSGSVFQRGNSSPRAPGCKCPQRVCPNPCPDCGIGQKSMNPGAVCCGPAVPPLP